MSASGTSRGLKFGSLVFWTSAAFSVFRARVVLEEAAVIQEDSEIDAIT